MMMGSSLRAKKTPKHEGRATMTNYPCAKSRQVDENTFFNNMILDGAPHLIDLAEDAKVFNFLTVNLNGVIL